MGLRLLPRLHATCARAPDTGGVYAFRKRLLVLLLFARHAAASLDKSSLSEIAEPRASMQTTTGGRQLSPGSALFVSGVTAR